VTRSVNLSVKTIYDTKAEGIALVIYNLGPDAERVSIVDAYSGETVTHQIEPRDTFTHFTQLHKTFGWYDFTVKGESDASFERQLAGHIETGRDSMTDPAIGAAVSQASVVA
jgi:phospholipase C